MQRKTRVRTSNQEFAAGSPLPDWDASLLTAAQMFCTQAYFLSIQQLRILSHQDVLGARLLQDISRLKRAGLILEADLLVKPMLRTHPTIGSRIGLASIDEMVNSLNDRHDHLELKRAFFASRQTCNLFAADYYTSPDHDWLQAAFNQAEIFVAHCLASSGYQATWIRGDYVNASTIYRADAAYFSPTFNRQCLVFLRRPSLLSRIELLAAQCRVLNIDFEVW